MLQKIKRFLKWEGTQKPEFDIDTKLYEELKPFRLPIILLILISVIGTLGYIAIDDMSPCVGAGAGGTDMGALEPGCEPVAVEETSWGCIKALFQ